MSSVIWTPTAYIQFMKRPTPAGTVLPPGEQLEVLQQWWLPSDGSGGQWREVPTRWWGEVIPNPT